MAVGGYRRGWARTVMGGLAGGAHKSTTAPDGHTARVGTRPDLDRCRRGQSGWKATIYTVAMGEPILTVIGVATGRGDKEMARANARRRRRAQRTAKKNGHRRGSRLSALPHSSKADFFILPVSIAFSRPVVTVPAGAVPCGIG